MIEWLGKYKCDTCGHRHHVIAHMRICDHSKPEKEESKKETIVSTVLPLPINISNIRYGYVAMNKDGTWWGHPNKPDLNTNTWGIPTNARQILFVSSKRNWSKVDWKESLHEVKNGVAVRVN